MIQHHNGALIMVKDLFDTPGAGQDADLFNFATDADNTQRAEIRIMQSMLDKDQSERGKNLQRRNDEPSAPVLLCIWPAWPWPRLFCVLV